MPIVTWCDCAMKHAQCVYLRRMDQLSQEFSCHRPAWLLETRRYFSLVSLAVFFLFIFRIVKNWLEVQWPSRCSELLMTLSRSVRGEDREVFNTSPTVRAPGLSQKV